jgi:hypothetical protein
MPKIQAHEHHSGIFETPAEMFEMPSGDRASQSRVGYFGLVAQASELTFCLLRFLYAE